MIDLHFTAYGLRDRNAPCRNVHGQVCRFLSPQSPLTVALEDPGAPSSHHSIRISNPDLQKYQVEDCADQIVNLIAGLVEIWQVPITLSARGRGATIMIKTIPRLPITGIDHIDLYEASAFSLPTFLTLDGLRHIPPKVRNHVQSFNLRTAMKSRSETRFGPADRPLYRGYLFQHGFWTDVIPPS
ncbi:MAG: hypothetical protein AAGJ34_04435 [Pseudomonadota bacterium]